MVEFALVAPLLFILLFGIIEFSILLFDKAMLTNASREGARSGIVFAQPRLDNAGIEAVVRAYCEDHLISFDADADLSVEITPNAVADRTSGVPLVVNIEYPFRFMAFSHLIGLLGGDYADVVNLRAITSMRME